MDKDNNLTGQPIIRQILKLIPRSLVDKVAFEQQSDHYYKKFKTFNHLVTMLYAVMSGSKNLRSVVLGLLASEKRLYHLGIKYFPKRSTLSDANRDRNSEVFASIYGLLRKRYSKLFPDSRKREDVLERIKIIDSTTMTLFKDILKAAGRTPADGKRKGGIKAHTVIDSGEDLPQFVCFSASARHDRPFLREMNFEKGDILTFDKAYNDYQMFRDWTRKGIYFCTREKDSALYELDVAIPIPDASDSRIIADQRIKVVIPQSGEVVLLRRIEFKDEENGRDIVFWTNMFFLNSDKVAQIYKRRWQIELIFKRLKQNFPLKYFLGDNVNAIEIQIWCCLIAHLLYKIVLLKTKRKWAFSNLCDVIRQHLFTYTNLPAFLEDPEKILTIQIRKKLEKQQSRQVELFAP